MVDVLADLVREEPVAELGIIEVGVVDRVGQVRLGVPRQDSVIPKSFAMSAIRTPSSRFRATRTTSSRNSLGYGLGMVQILSLQHHRAPQIRCHPAARQSQLARSDDVRLAAFTSPAATSTTPATAADPAWWASTPPEVLRHPQLAAALSEAADGHVAVGTGFDVGSVARRVHERLEQ